MNFIYIVSGVIAAALFIFLFVTLLRPDLFE